MKNFIVMDTNVLVSATKEFSLPERALKIARDNYDFVVSDATLVEMGDVFARRKILKAFDPERLAVLSKFMNRDAERIAPTVTLPPLETDPKDTKFVQLALSAGARILISGDRDLKVLGHIEYEGRPPSTGVAPCGFFASSGGPQYPSLERRSTAPGASY